MFIETEGTPNPATLKFLPGRYVMGAGTADFASPDSAERSPLAGALFALPGVARVFLGGDFITVTKVEETSWQALKPQVLAAIMEHFVAGRPVIEGAIEGAADEDLVEDDRPRGRRDRRADQGAAGHPRATRGGGRRRRHRVPRLSRRHRASCTCRVPAPAVPSSRATLKHGIENMLRHYVPEVVAVEQVDL